MILNCIREGGDVGMNRRDANYMEMRAQTPSTHDIEIDFELEMRKIKLYDQLIFQNLQEINNGGGQNP